MNNVQDSILVLCDSEEEYVLMMGEYLRKQKQLPWKVRTYTRVESLLAEEEQGQVTILVVSESIYTGELERIRPKKTVILNESGIVKEEKLCNINKYQPAEEVLKALLELYIETAKVPVTHLQEKSSCRFIGIYSPIRRCMQTRFALTMGQLLSRKARVLYLNFEHYAGDTELLEMDQARDLSDILYFMMADKDKFALHMQVVLKQKGEMDYIPPMKSGQNLLTISGEEWLKFMKKLDELGQYDYILMDLCDSMQGLFDILRKCHRIYTITQKDRIARSKVNQYEHLLQVYSYEDILEKTCKCNLPRIEYFPEYIEQYSTGALADYVESLVESMESDIGTASGERR